jgi:AcrR family transcriptional regulator
MTLDSFIRQLGGRRPVAGRRSPSPAAGRQRDPERTRQRILDAATAEFAIKGVNKQLIS